MKLFRNVLIIFFIFNLNSSIAFDESLNIKITKNLRCLICQGQSVYDSQSDFALSMKTLIKNNNTGNPHRINVFLFKLVS